MNEENLNFLIIAVILLGVIFIFIRIAQRLRKHGGSMTTTMHAATYEFLSKDLRESAKEVVEIKANKKMEEQSSDEPGEK